MNEKLTTLTNTLNEAGIQMKGLVKNTEGFGFMFEVTDTKYFVMISKDGYNTLSKRGTKGLEYIYEGENFGSLERYIKRVINK